MNEPKRSESSNLFSGTTKKGSTTLLFVRVVFVDLISGTAAKGTTLLFVDVVFIDLTSGCENAFEVVKNSTVDDVVEEMVGWNANN